MSDPMDGSGIRVVWKKEEKRCLSSWLRTRNESWRVRGEWWWRERERERRRRMQAGGGNEEKGEKVHSLNMDQCKQVCDAAQLFKALVQG